MSRSAARPGGPVPRRAVLAGLVTGLAGVTSACAGSSRAQPGPIPSSVPQTAPATTPPTVPATSPPTVPPTGPSAGPTPPWADLARQLTGRLLRPADPGYEVYRLAANPRYDGTRPAAVARCASAADVAATVRWARDAGVPFSVRSGGHSYGGWSTGTGLVLDLSAMSAVTVDPAKGIAQVGPGTRLVDVYRRLAGSGVGVAAGSCPSVAVAGLTLGGGVGVMTRTWGLTCDALTGYQLVDATGQARQVDEHADPDLLWAGRGGGGGSLGVVTGLTLAVRPAPDLTLFFLRWPWAAAVTVADAWQHWAPGADRRIWSTCKLLTTPTAARVIVAGAWSGPAAGLDGVLQPLLAGAGTAPVVRSARRHAFLEAMLTEAGCSTDRSCHLPPDGQLAREYEAATSHVPGALPPAAAWQSLAGLVEQLHATPGLVEAGVSLDALGGAVADLDPSASAFPHRASPFTVQYTATWTGNRPADPFDQLVRGTRAAMVPHLGNGAYVNYPDAALPGWQDAYWGPGYPRLQQVKRQVDPDDTFRFAQSIRS